MDQSNIERKKDGLYEKSTGRKIVSPADCSLCNAAIAIDFDARTISVPKGVDFATLPINIKGEVTLKVLSEEDCNNFDRRCFCTRHYSKNVS